MHVDAHRATDTLVSVTLLVVAGPSGLTEHDVGPHHPERPSRLAAVMEGVRALGPDQEIVTPSFGEASMDELARVHDPAYLARLAAFCAHGGGAIDGDTSARAASNPTPRILGELDALMRSLRSAKDAKSFSEIAGQ